MSSGVRSGGTFVPFATSVNGTNWTTPQTPQTVKSWRAVTFGNGLFVAVGYDTAAGQGAVMTSPDGITWTNRTAPASDNTWAAVTYKDGLFVAVSSSGTFDGVMTSGSLMPPSPNPTPSPELAKTGFDSNISLWFLGGLLVIAGITTLTQLSIPLRSRK